MQPQINPAPQPQPPEPTALEKKMAFASIFEELTKITNATTNIAQILRSPGSEVFPGQSDLAGDLGSVSLRLNAIVNGLPYGYDRVGDNKPAKKTTEQEEKATDEDRKARLTGGKEDE